MNFICFIAIPRTGTNHLGRVVSGFANIRSQYELFHTQAAYTLNRAEVEAVSKAAGATFRNYEDPALVDFARSKPGAFLDAVAAANDTTCAAVSYKVFPQHLDDALLRDEVLARPDTGVVIVRRRLLASFLSLRKAEEVNEYIDVDTTGVKVTLKASAYSDWRAGVLDWYDRVEALLAAVGKTPERLSYEDEIDTDPYTLAGLLVEKFGRLGVATTRDHGETPALEKQDKSKSLQDSVANWDEFERELSALDVPIDD